MCFQIKSDSCITESESNHLNDLRKLIECDQLLNRYKLNDDFLIAFLRCKLYDVDKAYQRLKLYIETIRNRQELFTWKCDAEKVTCRNMFGISKGQSADGSVLMLMKPSLWDPSDLSVEEIAQFIITYQAGFVRSQLNGIHAIVDASGVTWSQLFAVGPIKGKFIGELSSSVMPVRIRKVHMVHVNRLVRIGLKMVMPFMKKKIRERFVLHGDDLSDVFKCCPPSAVPVEYGGQATEQYSIEDHLKMIENGRCILEDVWQQVRDDCESVIKTR
ncbi:alpha-tocopherol transfer protein-like [Brevipalpus obovatus]|uniref:alpha-tocopherol transfer protein-like n=1 Tax=Brevipalpus obovatus TaxID=246614 RepID=UPI003D9DB26E